MKKINVFSKIIDDIIFKDLPIKIFSLPPFFFYSITKFFKDCSSHHFDTEPILRFGSKIYIGIILSTLLAKASIDGIMIYS